MLSFVLESNIRLDATCVLFDDQCNKKNNEVDPKRGKLNPCAPIPWKGKRFILKQSIRRGATSFSVRSSPMVKVGS